MASQYIRYPSDQNSGGTITNINTTAVGPSVSILGGTGITVNTVGNNITINATGAGSVTNVTGTSPIHSSGGTTPNISVDQSSSTTDGYLSSVDWNTFNNKQATISGPANTLVRFDGSGNLDDVPNWQVNGVDGSLNMSVSGPFGNLIMMNLNSDAAITGNFIGLDVNTNNLTTSSSIVGMSLVAGNASTSASDIRGLDINLQTASAPTGAAVGININVGTATDSNPQGVTGIQSDGRIQINATTQLKATQTFQIGSRIEHAFIVPPGSPVTGTDSLAINIAGDLSIEDNVADGITAGLVGVSAVGFISSLGVAVGKTVDTLNVFLPQSALPDPGFTTGGTVTNFSIIRSAPPLLQGGSLNITNLYGLKIDTGLAAAATNSWGIYIADPTSNNHFGGPVDMAQLQLNGSTSGRLDINAAAVTASYALTMPTAQGTSGQTLSNNGSGVLSWASPFVNPMTTGGDLIYGGASGAPTRLANGSAGQLLQSNGTTTAPSWTTPTAGANTTLSNLASTAVNADIVPDAVNSHDIGTFALPFNHMYARTMVVGKNTGGSGLQVYDGTGGGDLVMLLNNSSATLPSGVSARSSIRFSAGFSGAFAVFNEGLNDLRFETGNNGAGASNSIILQTGTATTTRGDVNISGNSISLSPVTSVNMNSKKIISLLDPTSAQDAATKAYVDAALTNQFKFNASSQVTTASTSVSSGTFTTISNSPALSFTPTVTGTYKVYASVPLEADSALTVAVARIIDTTGTPIVLYESQGVVGFATGVQQCSSVLVQTVYTLTASTAYVFDIQIKRPTGPGGSVAIVRGDNSPFYMFAELCG